MKIIEKIGKDTYVEFNEDELGTPESNLNIIIVCGIIFAYMAVFVCILGLLDYLFPTLLA